MEGDARVQVSHVPACLPACLPELCMVASIFVVVRSLFL